MANKTNTKTTYNAADEAAIKVDEQGILDRFNAATTAQYNVQRDQNRLAENQFYNKMYNTQKTAMDTIRQNNAAAVATGASRGVQAANELSALLGLQQESVAGATEVAQAQRQTAQEETAAVLENVLKAYQQAEAERQNRRTAAIEGASVDATKEQIYLTEYNSAMADKNIGLANAMASQLAAMGYTFKEGVAIPPDSGDVTVPTGLYKNAGLVKKGTPSAEYNTVGDLTKSGVNANGDLVFTAADLADDKSKGNIYKVLNSVGIETWDVDQEILDLADTTQYDLISQTDLNADSQTGSAATYINTLVNDAEEGKIPVGSRIILNYGSTDGNDHYEYIYLGGTKFAHVNEMEDGYGWMNTANFKELKKTAEAKVYVPEGYQIEYGRNENVWGKEKTGYGIYKKGK